MRQEVSWPLHRRRGSRWLEENFRGGREGEEWGVERGIAVSRGLRSLAPSLEQESQDSCNSRNEERRDRSRLSAQSRTRLQLLLLLLLLLLLHQVILDLISRWATGPRKIEDWSHAGSD